MIDQPPRLILPRVTVEPTRVIFTRSTRLLLRLTLLLNFSPPSPTSTPPLSPPRTLTPLLLPPSTRRPSSASMSNTPGSTRETSTTFRRPSLPRTATSSMPLPRLFLIIRSMPPSPPSEEPDLLNSELPPRAPLSTPSPAAEASLLVASSPSPPPAPTSLRLSSPRTTRRRRTLPPTPPGRSQAAQTSTPSHSPLQEPEEVEQATRTRWDTSARPRSRVCEDLPPDQRTGR